MPRVRLILLVLLLAVPIPMWDANRTKSRRAGSDDIQGTWGVVAVQRDGASDPTQAGAQVIFAGDTVTFVSGVAEILDGLS